MRAGRRVVGLVIAALTFGSMSQGLLADNSDDKQIYRFDLVNKSVQMQWIQQLGFDVAGIDISNKTVDVVLSESELSALVTHDLFEVPFSAVNHFQDLDPQYHNPQKVEDAVKSFVSRFPDLAQAEVIGKSHDNRSIWAVKISDNVAKSESDEPTILFNSMHHAREIMTTEVAIDTIDYLLTQYGKNAKVTNWVDSNEIWVVPMLNVDGNNKVWNSNNMWRKNTRGGYGVDINRNYPYGWKKCNGSSGFQWSDTYRGPSAGSEPETQALMGLVARIRPVFDISYHSYSELVIYPYGCDGDRTPTREVVEKVGKEIAQLMPKDSGSGTYAPGTAWELLYSVDGGDIDWMYGAFGVIPFVIELNGRNLGFQPSYSKWRQSTVEKARPAWGRLLDRLSLSGVRGRVILNSGRKPSVVKVKVESIDNPQLSVRTRTIGDDGIFHEILEPGTYRISVSDGSNTLPPETVTIRDQRVDIELEF